MVTGPEWLVTHAPTARCVAIDGTPATEDPRTSALEHPPELGFLRP
ncbi:MAG: hypothetical protein ACKOOG_13485 [Actinomycetota bacterium]